MERPARALLPLVTKKKGTVEPAIVRAAQGLSAAVDELDKRTRRVAKAELNNREGLVRAGELLQHAADGHADFLTRFDALSQAASELRERQNASATVLTNEVRRLDERRKVYSALEERFAALGQLAREIAASVKEIDKPEERDKLGPIQERLASAVEDARSLANDAGAADFGDLERQAHAMRQQIQALHNRLEQLRGTLH